MSKARIIGLGSYLPKKILTNADLEKMVDTTDEWIFTRTGMKERRIAHEGEFTSHMGHAAALIALEKGGLTPEDIDLILVATMSPDYMYPSTACLIQASLNAKNAVALDIQAACTGFIYGLSIAKAYIESGLYQNILLIASEKMSALVDYQDRASCVLFGDGAAAAVITNKGAGFFIDKVLLGADGSVADLLMVEAGGTRQPATLDTIQSKKHYMKLNGKELFKHAVRRMANAASEIVSQSKLHLNDIAWLIPHQANTRIIDGVVKMVQFPEEKVFKTIHKYGNTSASSVAIALDELSQEKEIQLGEKLLLVAFGAGLTWGSVILTKGCE
jgi:3-oxoacyl-[acyl-carrier-protein] synthase-3